MSTISVQIDRWITNIKEMLVECAATMKTVRDVGSYRAQSIYQAFIVGTGGIYTTGSSGDFVAVNLGQSTNVYLHFKLPLKNTDNLVPVTLLVKGYSYGESKNLLVKVGLTMNSGTLSKTLAGTHTTNAYVDGNGNIVVSVFFPIIYYLTFALESSCHIDSKRPVRGQIEVKASLSSTVLF